MCAHFSPRVISPTSYGAHCHIPDKIPDSALLLRIFWKTEIYNNPLPDHSTNKAYTVPLYVYKGLYVRRASLSHKKSLAVTSVWGVTIFMLETSPS